MTFCSECGQQIDKNVKFCPKCGAPNVLSSGASSDSDRPRQPVQTPSHLHTEVEGGGGYGLDERNLSEGFELDGRFRIEKRLGIGGFAAVYLAFDTQLKKDRAVKVFCDLDDGDEYALSKLRHEADLMEKISDDRIIRYFDLRLDSSPKYAVLEYIDGGNLEQLILRSQGGKLSEKEALRFAREIADAMQVVHSKGIIHKDLKPNNVMLTKSGQIKIMDFGISEALTTARSRLDETSRAGTAHYMSPEQIIGKNVGPEADVWSFGVLLYQMLTGEILFAGSTRDDVHTSIKGQLLVELDRKAKKLQQYGDIEPIVGISDKTNALIGKCLKYDYTERFRTFGEVIEEIDAILTPAPLPLNAQLHVTSDPGAATVFLDGRELGHTPFHCDDLEPGSGLLVVKKTGCETTEQQVLLTAGEPTTIHSKLIPQTGKIDITCSDSGAIISLDGNRMGRFEATPLRVDSVAIGAHTVSAELGGFESLEQRVLVDRNRTTEVFLSLKAVHQEEKEAVPAALKRKASRGWLFIPLTLVALVIAYFGFNALPKPVSHTAGSLPGMTFVRIPGGSFLMGSPPNEEDRDDDENQHRVTLSGFEMLTTEVTQGMWTAIMDSNPSKFKGNNLPVERVSWNDCQEFIKKLNQRDPGKGYRLPTEAEWEYACRAGTTTPFNTGKTLDASAANYDGNYPYTGGRKGVYREKTVSVGSFSANAWGLYDMHGNVWEWCVDWYDSYPSGSVTDPRGPSSGSYRVCRGGGWLLNARNCLSAYRGNDGPSNRLGGLGFRLVRSHD